MASEGTRERKEVASEGTRERKEGERNKIIIFYPVDYFSLMPY